MDFDFKNKQEQNQKQQQQKHLQSSNDSKILMRIWWNVVLYTISLVIWLDVSCMTNVTSYVTHLAKSGVLIKTSHLQNYLPQQTETSECCCLNFMQFVKWISYQPSIYWVCDYPGCTFSKNFFSVPRDLSTVSTHV